LGALLDARCLQGADAMADDRPGRGLIWRPEQDRPQAGIRALQAPNHGSPSYGLKLGSVDIQRQDAGDLLTNSVPRCIPEDLADHELVRLANAHPYGVLPTALNGECKVKVARGLRAVESGGSKALKEARARLERELTLGCDAESRHVAPLGWSRSWNGRDQQPSTPSYLPPTSPTV